MSEQLCETNGYETGANDLTWSYGTFLSAQHTRKTAVESGAIELELEKNPLLPTNVTGAPCGTCANQCSQ